MRPLYTIEITSATYGPLSTLGDLADKRVTGDLSLENINFWRSTSDKCPIAVFWSWMGFSRTCTARKALARKVRKHTIHIRTAAG